MADSKITALTALTAADPVNDMFPVVDVSDTTMAASGTTKKISVNNILGASGTATLASATITGAATVGTTLGVTGVSTLASAVVTGDLTVDSSTLKVDSTNNRVGIGTATPSQPLHVKLDQNAYTYSRIDNQNASSGAYAALMLSASGNSWGIGVGSTAANSNALDFFLDAGGANSLKMRLDSSGNLALGTTSADTTTLRLVPTNTDTVQRPLHIGYNGAMSSGVTGTYISFGNSTPSTLQLARIASYYEGGTYSGSLRFYTNSGTDGANPTERLRVDSSGNVGIGVTPSAWLSSLSALQVKGVNGIYGAGSSEFGSVQNCFYNASSQWIYGTTAAAGKYAISSGVHQWYNAPSGTAGNAITFTQAMTLDASGNLLVGLTVDSYTPAKGVSMFSGNSSRVAVGHANGTSSGDYYHSFAYNSTLIGSISQNGTTGVLFNTSSDYRLKESVKPISGGLARVNALKPSIYNWKSDGSTGEGFLAHELAEVVPFAVSGEKDAVNADGTIKSQGIDISRIVPILVAAIQELTAEVNALKNA